ncbi:MAG TPA: enoyl-CoA hydratase/isomerase family protein, partial [Devosiaceae bacterium]|nr:enoyl-CoA hydratase/isomerase family protein [Devosiaceae bacterium]
MSEAEVLVDRLGGLAVIRLNRPRVINALSLTMIESLVSWLTHLSEDAGVTAILLRGEGERGFCAGGDVKAVREAVQAGRPGAARHYFATEYRLDALVAACPKPVIAFQHGVVMGGGVGLSAPARHRVGVTGAQFAMPEPAIGFFADVGVNFALRGAPRHRALAFTMSGLPVGVADARALGLCDAEVAPADLDTLQAELVDAAAGAEPAAAIAAAIAGLEPETGEAAFCAVADALRAVFEAPDPAALTARLETAAKADPRGFAATLADAFGSGCPTSQ